jgi:hypothetical protein
VLPWDPVAIAKYCSLRPTPGKLYERLGNCPIAGKKELINDNNDNQNL